MAVLKACPRCKGLIPAGLQYCARCAPIVEAKRQEYRDENARKKAAAYNRRRDPKYSTFYRSKEWRLTSRAILQAASYKCNLCGGLAVEVHHIKPIQTPDGWAERLDAGNLEALCTGCHNKRHNRGASVYGQGVIDMRFI